MRTQFLSRRAGCFTLAIILSLVVPVGLLADALEDPASGRRDLGPKRGTTSKKPSAKRAKRAKKRKSSMTDREKRKARERLPITKLPTNERRDAKFLRDLGEGFKMKHTNHYVIFYNTGDDDVRKFSIAIEKIYRQVTTYIHKLGIEVKEPKYKLVTHYFNTFEEYSIHSAKCGHGLIEEGALGFYVPVSLDADRIDPMSNMTYFYNIRNTPGLRGLKRAGQAGQRRARERSKGKPFRPGEREAVARGARSARALEVWANNRGLTMTESTLQHEITHQVLFNTGFHNFGTAYGNPLWMVEGMAQIFQTPSDGDRWGVALINKERLELFMNLHKRNALIPIRKFVSDPRYFWIPSAGGLAYPQGWAMIQYITRKKRDELREYVEIVNARPVNYKTTPEKELETFEKAFGPLDEEWEGAWLRWMETLRP